MSGLPKLKVELPFGCGEEVYTLEGAKDHLVFDGAGLVSVEGQLVNSYEELVQVASQYSNKDKEFLSVKVFPLFCGG